MSAPGRAPVAVVVPCRDRPEHLDAALAAIRRALRPGDEVVVVDSASRARPVAPVAERHGVAVLRCELPGVARARNAGFAHTSAALVACTDDDCVVDPGWLDACAAAFDDPRVGFVAGMVVPEPPSPLALSVVVDERPRRFRAGADPARIGHSANLVWRREALASIGGFDELLGAGARLAAAAEHDACWRALRAGWEGRYDPALVVHHRQWRGRAEFLRASFRYGVGSGALASKATRLDRGEGRVMLRRALWDRGVGQAARDLAHGYESGAAGALAHAAGALVGAVAGSRLRVVGDRFAG